MTAGGLLLAADQVVLYPPGGDADGHGWAEPGAGPYWAGTGNLQLAAGASDPRAAEGGGHGPYAPAAGQAGQLFLPPSVPLAEGSLAVIRGKAWVLSQVRLVADPADPAGGIACQSATVTEADWPLPEAGGDGEGP